MSEINYYYYRKTLNLIREKRGERGRKRERDREREREEERDKI